MVSVDIRTEVFQDIVGRASDYRNAESKRNSLPYPVKAIVHVLSGDARSRLAKLESTRLKGWPESFDNYLTTVSQGELREDVVGNWAIIMAGAMTETLEGVVWGDASTMNVVDLYNSRIIGTYLPRLDSNSVTEHSLLISGRTNSPFLGLIGQDAAVFRTLKRTMQNGKYPNLGHFFGSYANLEEVPPLAATLESLLRPQGIERVETKKGYLDLTIARPAVEKIIDNNDTRHMYFNLLSREILVQGKFINEAAHALL